MFSVAEMIVKVQQKRNVVYDATIGWRRSVVISALASINVVNRHWARLLLGWVTARGQTNRLGI